MFNLKNLRTTVEDALDMVKYIANQNRIIDTSHHTFKAVFLLSENRHCILDFYGFDIYTHTDMITSSNLPN